MRQNQKNIEAMIEAKLERDSKGQLIYTPWRILGKKYIVPEIKEAELRNALRKYLQRSGNFLYYGAIATFILGFTLGPILILAYLNWMFIEMRKITKELIPVTPMGSRSSSSSDTVYEMKSLDLSALTGSSTTMLTAGFLICFLIFLGSFWFIDLADANQYWLPGIFFMFSIIFGSILMRNLQEIDG